MTGAQSSGRPSSIMRRPPSMIWSGSLHKTSVPSTSWGMNWSNPVIRRTDFGDELEGAAKDADNASSKFDKVGSVVKGMGVAIGAAVVAAGAALAGLTKSFLDLAESTREYREDQAKLDAAFITAGFTTDQASGKPISLFIPFSARKIEALRRSTTLPSCAAPRRNWHSGQILPLAYGLPLVTAFPLRGLTEAANETAKTGQITGQLADALNWAGFLRMPFSAFWIPVTVSRNGRLSLPIPLNGLYAEAAENYKELNGDVMAAQRAQAELTDAYAELGAIAGTDYDNAEIHGGRCTARP